MSNSSAAFYRILAGVLAVIVGAELMLFAAFAGTEKRIPLVAALVYPTTKGATVALLTADGRATPCFSGSQYLAVGQVLEDRLVYVDGDLYERSIDCSGKPRRLLSLRGLLGREPHLTPADSAQPFFRDSFTSPALSPDRRRLIVRLTDCVRVCSYRSYIADANGDHARRFPSEASGWVDDTHLLAHGFLGDAYALGLNGKTQAFLDAPQRWNGRASNGGGLILYSLVGGSDSGLYGRPRARLFDVRARTTKGIKLPEPFFDGGPFAKAAQVDGTGKRVAMLTVGDREPYPCDLSIAETARGTLIQNVKVSETTQSCAFQTAWINEHSLWVVDADGLRVVDLETARLSSVALPGHSKDTDETADIVSIEYAGRPTLHKEPSLHERASLSAEDLGSFHATVPPGWKFAHCACGPAPYAHAITIFGAEPFVDFPRRGFNFTVAETRDPVPTAVARLRARYRQNGPLTMAGTVDRIRTGLAMLGGLPFQMVQFHFSHIDDIETDESDAIYVGRARGRTFVLTTLGPKTRDPSDQLLLDSIRFN